MKIPEDEVESGSGVKKWVNATFYGKDEAEVNAKRQKYFDQYPPRGYDTHTITIPTHMAEGYWLCRVSRYSTCS
jgi:hypothetical protein